MTRSGRTLVALSPGSRSTPLVLALAARPELEVIDVIDERAAAFFALSHARATGQLAVVVATSGTAPAHWYPAAIEASESGVPLLLLSADRPTELAGCGAPQTIDQVRLFGAHVRASIDLGDPAPTPAWQRHVARQLAIAIDRATTLDPGPVHVNVRARKPLEPSEPRDATDNMAETIASVIAQRGRGALTIARRTMAHDDRDLEAVAGQIAEARRPLVLVGPLAPTSDPRPIAALAERMGAPLAAEWGSQLRRPGVLVLGALERLIGHPALDSDLILQVGGAPTASVYERWTSVGDRPLPRIVIGPRLADAAGMASWAVLGDPSTLCASLLDRVSPREPWAGALDRAHARAVAAIAHELRESSPIGEGAVAVASIDALPPGATLMLGNSLPIRLADTFALEGRDVKVVVQRGVNGIDGWIAGACGTAHASTGPVLALVGDVTALHDVGSLALLARTRRPVTLVVIDNDGGRIFEGLPIGQRADLTAAMPHFVTSHGADLRAIAEAHGIASARVHTTEALSDALTTALRSSEPMVIVASVPPHDARDREARIRARIAAALETTP